MSRNFLYKLTAPTLLLLFFLAGCRSSSKAQVEKEQPKQEQKADDKDAGAKPSGDVFDLEEPSEELDGGVHLHHTQRGFMPPALRDVWLGMPKTEFMDTRTAAVSQDSPFDFRLEFVELMDDEEIRSVIYYVDSDADELLYEMIIDYKDPVERDKAVRKLLGKEPSDRKVWILDSGDGFPIKAWTHENKLILAAQLPGTEWEE